jgi:hypothetical protein
VADREPPTHPPSIPKTLLCRSRDESLSTEHDPPWCDWDPGFYVRVTNGVCCMIHVSIIFGGTREREKERERERDRDDDEDDDDKMLTKYIALGEKGRVRASENSLAAKAWNRCCSFEPTIETRLRCAVERSFRSCIFEPLPSPFPTQTHRHTQ